MRAIRIPAKLLAEPLKWGAKRRVITVKVDWPELRLTEDQIVANVLATVHGAERPYPDLSFISIELEG